MSPNPVVSNTVLPATVANPVLPAMSLRQPIRCAISGSVLGTLDVGLVEGALPFLQDFARMEILHPFFGQTDYNLLKKLKESLDWFSLNEWESNPVQVNRIQVLLSATMHRLGVLKQETQTLPGFSVCVGSAHRIYFIANWWLNTSKRVQLPRYSISARNDNLQWQNIRWWLDECYGVKEVYDRKVRQVEHDEELRFREGALREIKSEHMRRIDNNKVWRWIELQLSAGAVAAGRIVTYKDLFMGGDVEPEKWNADDVDDLVYDIEDHCDIGHEIMFYVKRRLSAIRQTILDFYGAFTVVNLKLNVGETSAEERQKEEELFSGYDKTAEVLETLPNPPQQKDFATLGLFLKAQANWRLLKSRFELIQQRKQETGKGN